MTFEELFTTERPGAIASRIRSIDALRSLFGAGYHGARDALEKIDTLGAQVLDPIDHDTAIKYHEVARRAIASGRDLHDVQLMRIQIMEKALKHQVSK